MTPMKNCILCFYEFEEESLPCYPLKLPELCCKYLHSSLTQETLLRQSDHLNLSFCAKCFESVVELGDINEQLEFYQKRISEFVFIMSLEILHRRGNSSNDQNSPNYRNWKRKLVEFDVSTLPHCDFKKNAPVISEEIETSSLECHNSEDFNDPFVIPSTPIANTVEVTFEKIKVDTDNHSGIDDEISATDDIRTDFSIKQADQSSPTGQTGNKRLSPRLKLQRLNFQGKDQVIFIENDQDNLNHSSGNGDKKSQTIWTKSDCGGHFKINKIRKNYVSENGSEVSTPIPDISTVNSISDSSNSQQISEKKEDSDARKTSVTNSTNNFEKQNYRLKDSISRTFQCHVCDKMLSTEQEMEVHAAVHSEALQYNCDVCGKKFKTNECMLKHKITHSEERPHKSAIGKKIFKPRRHLLVDKMVHREGRLFKCEVCGKEFRKRCNLQRHSQIHTVGGPHKCEFCGKGFSHQTTLENHRRIHTKERPYKCDFCGKVFPYQTKLEDHRRIHTKERPYKCDFCGKGFKQKSQLTPHIKIHTGEMPFKCDECDYTAIIKGNLKMHKILKHSSLKNFKCGECKEDFKTKRMVKQHYKRVHFALDFSDDCVLENI